MAKASGLVNRHHPNQGDSWAWLTVSAMRQLELAEQSVPQMSAASVRVQEEEQRRIAREVHDSTSQEKTALILNLGALKKSPEIPRVPRKTS
jgi:signal transduction histidine kinase